MAAAIIEYACAELPTLGVDERARLAAGPIDPAEHDRLVETLVAFDRVEVVPPAAPATAPDGAVRVAAWNMERAKYLAPSARLLADVRADVALLCEMDLGMARSGQHHTTRLLAGELGHGHVFGVEFVELDLGDARERDWHAGEANRHGLHGAAILSPHELARPAMIRLERDGRWFDGSRGERRIGGRIALAATLELPQFDLACVSVHFESHSDPAHRAEQMTVLLDAIDAYHGAGPVVLGGDFNTMTASWDEVHIAPGKDALLAEDPQRLADPARYEPMFDVAVARGYDWAAANTAEPTQRTRPDGTPQPPHARIDWFFTRGLEASDPATVPAVDSAGTAISDHDLLAVTVRPR